MCLCHILKHYVMLCYNHQLRRPYDTLSFLTIHQQTANELAIITSWMYIVHVATWNARSLSKVSSQSSKTAKIKMLINYKR